MSLEQIIQANTEAVIALTEALLKQQLVKVPVNTEPASKALDVEEKASTKYTKEVSGAKYTEVRELVLKLAKDNGAAIKELYKKIGISKPSELLTDPENFDSEVTDQAKLNAIYEGLINIDV